MTGADALVTLHRLLPLEGQPAEEGGVKRLLQRFGDLLLRWLDRRRETTHHWSTP